MPAASSEGDGADLPEEHTGTGQVTTGEPGTAPGPVGGAAPDDLPRGRRRPSTAERRSAERSSARPPGRTTGRIPALPGKLGELEAKVGEGLRGLEHKVGEGLRGLESKVDDGLHRLEHKVGESLDKLPVMPRTRKSRVLVRSVLVGFLLVFTWIGAIVWWQLRKSPTPDLRPQAEAILVMLRDGEAAKVYNDASPRFQELVLEQRFLDDMAEMGRTLGRFLEITAVDETEITRGPGGRTGRVGLRLLYEHGATQGDISFHWDEQRWKLLGISIRMPEAVAALEGTREKREERVRAPAEIRTHVESALALLRDGKVDQFWDDAAPVFQSSMSKQELAGREKNRRDVLGVYRRILHVTSSRQNPGQTSATLDALVEYDKAVVTVTFGFTRVGSGWKLSSYKLVLPQPRVPTTP